MSDTEDLFSRYIEICNLAIRANKDRFPYKQILESVENETELNNVEVCIIDDRPEAGFFIQLDSHQITSQKADDEEISVQSNDNGSKWCITLSYLEEIVNNPIKYIDNPAKIDWEWMQKRSN